MKNADSSPDGELSKAARVGSKPAVASTSQATALVDLAAEAELWQTSDRTAYATIKLAEHCEHWRLRSRPFAQWMAERHFARHRAAVHHAALADALAVLEARAWHTGAVHPVFSRVAEKDGEIYLDLADAGWRAVRIGPKGWSVVSRPPVRFRRSSSMLELPEPQRGKPLTLLRRFVHVCDADWPLVAAWLVAAIRPRGPYPVLFLHGEHGSGKSTQAQVLRSLVDPNSAPLRAEPKEAHDLAVTAQHSWVIALDNVSRLPGWLSDALCRLSTGGGFATRTLYENDEETILQAQRPVLINGIDDLATRGDLLDRSLVVQLPQITMRERRTEADFQQEFEHCRPWLIGALAEAVATALARLPLVRIGPLPRLADFAKWGVAAEPALGCKPREFASAFMGNKLAIDQCALESSPIVPVLRRRLEAGPWRGTAGELLSELERLSKPAERRRPGWPSSTNKLSSALRRLTPNLRAVRVIVDFSRGSGSDRRRLITLRRGTRH